MRDAALLLLVILIAGCWLLSVWQAYSIGWHDGFRDAKDSGVSPSRTGQGR